MLESLKRPAAWLPVVASTVSLALSIISVIYTGLSYRDSHTQILLSRTPLVSFDTENDPLDPPVGIALVNTGTTPAAIGETNFYVDGHKVEDLEAAAKLGNFNIDDLSYFEFEEGDALAIGERDWLVRLSPSLKLDRREAERFADFINNHLAIEVQYCSGMGDCWQKCSTKGHCSHQ